MKSMQASLLIGVFVFTQTFAWAETVSPQVTSDKSSKETVQTSINVKHEFPVVNADQIEMDLQAVIETSSDTKDELNVKIRNEYVPIRISLINKSGKLLQIPRESIYFLMANGDKVVPPSDEEIYKNIKRNGVGRALAWGVPLGVVSFGILAVPAFVWSGAHTKFTNSSTKASLEKNFYNGGHLSPEGAVSTFLYLPKKHADAKQLVLGRVINEEDQVETEKVITIQTKEISHAQSK